MTAGDAWVRRHPAYRAVVRGWPAGGLLACSGGVDSSALLVLAGIGVRRGDIQRFEVVHVDHLTRPESASEGDIVARLAEQFGLRAIQTSVDLVDTATASSSPEDRLRALRYAALARVAADSGSPDVITAHTRNDQVETVLMRLLTGAGGLAVAGMSARSTLATTAGEIVIHRPLLDVSRAELLDVVRRAGVSPLIDPSNADRDLRRNALRLDVIPRLHEAFPGFDASLLRSVTLAARDAAALDALADTVVASIAACRDHETRVERGILRNAHPAVATRVIRWAAGRLMPANQREFGFERVESVREAAGGRAGALIELPYGVVARVERSEIVFERRNQ